MYYEMNDKTVRKFFLAIKKDASFHFDTSIDYEEAKQYVDVVWEAKCTFAEAVKEFNNALKTQVDAGNRGKKFKSIILYNEEGKKVKSET